MKNILKLILCVLVCYVTIGLGWITKDVIIHENVKNGIAVLGYHGVVSDKKKKTMRLTLILCLSANLKNK